MRRALFLLLATALCRPLLAADRNVFDWRAGFGFPETFSLQAGVPITKRLDLALGLGFLPISLFGNPFSPMAPEQLSDTHELTIDPSMRVFVPHIAAYFTPEGRAFWLRFSFGVVIADAVGRGVVRNKDTGESVSLAKVQAVLFQPVLSTAVGLPIWKGESTSLELLGGISLFLPTSIHTSVTGSLPAYLAVVPEAFDSFDDALGTAKSDLTATLRKLQKRPFLLPTFAIQMKF